jgi:hypothetical protein
MPMIELTEEMGTPVLINSDWIAYAKPVQVPNAQSVLHMAMGDGKPEIIHVKEPLDRISNAIRNAY